MTTPHNMIKLFLLITVILNNAYTGFSRECHNHRVANLEHPVIRILTNIVVKHSRKDNLNNIVNKKYIKSNDKVSISIFTSRHSDCGYSPSSAEKYHTNMSTHISQQSSVNPQYFLVQQNQIIDLLYELKQCRYLHVL